MASFYNSNKDTFLYECDEVPFDEIPPEPGREIQNSGYGDLVIHVQKDSHHTDEPNYDDIPAVSPSTLSPLKRTIHQDSGQVCQKSLLYLEDDYIRGETDTHRKRRNLVSRQSPENRYSKQEWDTKQSNSMHSESFKQKEDSVEIYHNEPEARSSGNTNQFQFDTSRLKDYESNTNYRNSAQQKRDYQSIHNNSNKINAKYTAQQMRDLQGRNKIENVRYTAQQARDSKITKGKQKYTAQQLRDLKNNDRESSWDNERCDYGIPSPSGNFKSTSHQSERTPLLKETNLHKPGVSKVEQPLSERLGPPVYKNISSVRKSPTSFIERNKASVSVSKNKRLIVGTIGKKPVLCTTFGESSKPKSEIKKVTIRNPISKAKQRVVPHKSNLLKNIALNKKNYSNNETASSSKSSNNDAISHLIQGILSEPDVKEIISSIAHQTVSNSPEPYTPENPSSKFSLEADATRILDRASELINTNFKGVDADEFQTNRKIPPMKAKHVKLSLYCKDCKLEFPTTMLRDLHYKTEMHCFVNGDWWKFNPKPLTRIPKNKYPLSIFCILCWDIVRLQSAAVFEKHMSGKRHKTNHQKFSEIFSRAPMYEWCMWEELSMNFRNNFVPVPSQLRNTMHPEYFYDQRVIRK